MPLSAQSLNLFNNQTLPLAQSGINLLPQFAAPYKEGVSYTKRVPNCQKCGQHGRKSRLKGHKRVCPFKDCNCAKCQVVTERQKLMADQIKIRRRQRKDNIMNLTRENLKTLNAISAVAADPLPYINNLNMLCKQIAQAQQPGNDSHQDLENQQPNQQTVKPTLFNPTTSLASFSGLGTLAQPLHSSSITTTTVSAFSPQNSSHHAESPHMVSSPMSTIGTEASLSPQQHPRAYSFDLGFLQNQNQQQQLLNAALSSVSNAPQEIKSTVDSIPTSSGATFGMSPPQSAGLAAPIPLNPMVSCAQPSPTNLGYDQLVALSQLLNLGNQQPTQFVYPTQFVAPQPQQQINLQEVLSLASFILQQHHQLSPPPEEKPHSSNSNNNNQNNFIDVCSV